MVGDGVYDWYVCMKIRSKKIMESARGERCTIISPVCNHDQETTVCAHSNWVEHGKSMGQKADDIFVAYACSDCHAWLDHGPEEKAMKRDYWMRGHALTLKALINKGVVIVR